MAARAPRFKIDESVTLYFPAVSTTADGRRQDGPDVAMGPVAAEKLNNRGGLTTSAAGEGVLDTNVRFKVRDAALVDPANPARQRKPRFVEESSTGERWNVVGVSNAEPDSEGNRGARCVFLEVTRVAAR